MNTISAKESRMLTTALCVVLVSAAFLGIALAFGVSVKGVAADERRPSPAADASAPNFRGATLEEVLGWARDAMGIATVYADDERLRGARISFSAPTGLAREDSLIALFEALRASGVVMMPIWGMRTPTYQVMGVETAASYTAVASDMGGLEGYYFGSLLLEPKHLSLAECETLARKFSSAHATVATVESVTKLVVSDFVDNLRSLHQAFKSADHPVERDEDIVSHVVRATVHDATSLAAALRAEHGGIAGLSIEAHAGTGSVVMVGRRADVERIEATVRELDRLPLLESARVSLHRYVASFVAVEMLVAPLRELFRDDLARGQVRITLFKPERQIIVECDGKRYATALELLRSLDRENTGTPPPSGQ